jgi:hypothetical protein
MRLHNDASVKHGQMKFELEQLQLELEELQPASRGPIVIGLVLWPFVRSVGTRRGQSY